MATHLALSLLMTACGGEDVTRFVVAEEEAAPPEPEPSASRTFGVLAERTALDAVCRWIGVSSVAGTEAARDPGACSAVVDDCRSDVEAVLGRDDGAAGVRVPPTDLEGLLGCPLTLAELDGCIAAALERGIDEYGSSIGCDMPALPAVDPLALLGSAECIGVALRCPELVVGLTGR